MSKRDRRKRIRIYLRTSAREIRAHSQDCEQGFRLDSETHSVANVSRSCNCHIHRQPGKLCRRDTCKNTLARRLYYCWIGLGSEVLIVVIAWSRNRGWVSGCSGDSLGNYSRVTTTNIGSLSHSFSRVLGLRRSIFPCGFSHLRRSSLSKITALSAPALVYHHLLSTTFTIKWPRNCDCFT